MNRHLIIAAAAVGAILILLVAFSVRMRHIPLLCG